MEFYASGYTTSTDGEVIGNHGGGDGWITGEIVFSEPVVLSSFSASIINKEVLVKWASATEINSDNFEVQHSINGTNFSIVGKVKSFGNANKYQFTDKTPNEGINYYRLKMIDKDGSFTYSKIVSVQLIVGNHSFSVVPNPAKDFTTISFAKTIDKATIAVYDISGKAVITQSLSGSNDYKLNTQTLVNGVYLIKVSTAFGSYNEKLYINK